MKHPNDMTAKELREELKRYGTAHLYELRASEMRDRLLEIRKNERLYGMAERPHGVFADHS